MCLSTIFLESDNNKNDHVLMDNPELELIM